jgi:hypothetical protein
VKGSARIDDHLPTSTSAGPEGTTPTSDSPIPGEPPKRVANAEELHDGCAPPTRLTSAASTSPRWWLAVGVGTVIVVPFAWLLSYVAALPFFIGLFFFLLFGLIVGAIMHRTASARRPYTDRPLLVGTTVVVLVGSLIPVYVEARDFPKDMAEHALTRSTFLGDRTGEEYKAAVRDEVRLKLRERFPPGGTLGYVKWVLKEGEWRKGELEGVRQTLGVYPCGFAWAVRVALSVGLLGFGIGSQTLALRRLSDPVIRSKDRRRQQSGG